MQSAIPSRPSQHQTTVTTRISRVILNEFSLKNNTAHFTRCNHSFRQIHLSHGVRQKQNPLLGYLSNGIKEIRHSKLSPL